MAELTASDYQTKIDAIDVALAAMVDSPSTTIIDVAVLDIQVKSTDKAYTMLLRLREYYKQCLDAIPTVEVLQWVRDDEAKPS